jgi:prepilin-type N-terminal cleavage/methylation domain-containing protein/prepilin-type processing-associated H-X9-DG protein
MASLRQKSGFTLVELMVVIMIIAALAALALMISGRVRRAGLKATSVNNLKQLQLANSLYATDHNGRYVPALGPDGDGEMVQHWDRNPDFLVHLRGEAPLSADGRNDVPVNLLDPAAYGAQGPYFDMLRGSYGMLERIADDSGAQGTDPSLRLARITFPERTAAFVTATDRLVAYGGRFTWSGAEDEAIGGIIAYRHNDKALVAYYDGHVSEITRGDMEAIDQNGGEEHPFWKSNQ